MKKHLLFAALSLCLAQAVAHAQAPSNPDIEKTHNELRALRDRLLDAVNRNDVDALLSSLDENVVVTFENAEVCRGRDGGRKYYEKMMTGPDHLVASYHTDVQVDELTILYGDATGVAFGSSADKFKLTNGSDFTVNGRWTATCVRKDGNWEVAAFHASTNMFDNPIVAKLKSWLYQEAAQCSNHTAPWWLVGGEAPQSRQCAMMP